MRFLSENEDYKWLASDHPSGHLLTSRWRLTKFVTNTSVSGKPTNAFLSIDDPAPRPTGLLWLAGRLLRLG